MLADPSSPYPVVLLFDVDEIVGRLTALQMIPMHRALRLILFSEDPACKEQKLPVRNV